MASGETLFPLRNLRFARHSGTIAKASGVAISGLPTPRFVNLAVSHKIYFRFRHKTASTVTSNPQKNAGSIG